VTFFFHSVVTQLHKLQTSIVRLPKLKQISSHIQTYPYISPTNPNVVTDLAGLD